MESRKRKGEGCVKYKRGGRGKVERGALVFLKNTRYLRHVYSLLRKMKAIETRQTLLGVCGSSADSTQIYLSDIS